MKIHKLKTLDIYFQAVLTGEKTFEIRINDRDFKVGDDLLLLEIEAVKAEDATKYKTVFTGRILLKKITYIFEGGNYGLAPGYVVLSLGNYW